jgi:carbonic anhydrase
MVKINLANSVTKISADSYVVEGIAAGSLQVHGEIYDVATGLLNFLPVSDEVVTAVDVPY